MSDRPKTAFPYPGERSDMPPSSSKVLAMVHANVFVAELLGRLRELELPQGHLVAGCLFQTIWSLREDAHPAARIRDYDVFYFDPDLSWEAEDHVIRTVARLCHALPIEVEVRNQARVHLWYEQRFGRVYPPLASAREGIERFLIECTCIGIEVSTGDLYAPNGLDDLWAGRLKPNPRHFDLEGFHRKSRDYRSRWPWLTIVEADASSPS